MKRVISTLIVIMMLLGMITTAYGNDDAKYVDVEVDGKVERVRRINVLVNGEEMVSDVPPVLYESRSLVPIRFAANYLDADVSWDGEKRQAHIKTEDKHIILTIDSPKVYINGVEQDITYNVPAKLINDRTMVPLRFVAESLGFEVGWIQESYTGLLTFETTRQIQGIAIEEQADAMPKIKIATSGDVETEVTPLEDPARLVLDIKESQLNLEDDKNVDGQGIYNKEVDQYPVETITASQFSTDPAVTRFVIALEKDMGYNLQRTSDGKELLLSFVNNVETIEKKEYDRREAIVIKNTELPEYRVFRLSNPDRIVLDLMDSVITSDQYAYDFDAEFIEGVRTSQFDPGQSYPGIDKVVRVVFDLEELDEKPYLVLQSDEEDMVLYVDEKGVENIKYEQEEGVGFIEIEAESRTRYDVDYDEDTHIMTVEIDEDDVDLKEGTLFINDGFIETIDIQEDGRDMLVHIQYSSDINFDVESRSRDDEVEIRFVNKVQKYKLGTIINHLEYAYEDEEGLIELHADGRTEYDVDYDDVERQMTITVPEDELDMEEMTLLVEDDRIKDIVVEKDDDDVEVSIQFETAITYEVESRDRDDDIVVSFTQVPGEYGDRLIVIDAGHGGYDPGTHGLDTGKNEKDMNLSVALKLDKKLKALGFKTLLTRDEDVYIGLYDRTDLANTLDADAFISIHFNAHPSRDIAGIQTLYCPTYDSTVKEEDQYPFASVIHKNLLSELGLVDKGIIKRSGLVVTRETKMVSALAELGFLSNAKEEAYITTEAYHDAAADALAKGIVEYFSRK